MWWKVGCVVAGFALSYCGTGSVRGLRDVSVSMASRSTFDWVLAVVGTVLSVVGVAGWLGQLLVRARHPWRIAAIVLTGMFLILAGGLGLEARPSIEELAKRAFVTTTDAQVHTAAAEISGNVIALPAGSEVRRIEERGDWCYIEVPQPDENVFGWVLAKNLVPVWPFDTKKLP